MPRCVVIGTAIRAAFRLGTATAEGVVPFPLRGRTREMLDRGPEMSLDAPLVFNIAYDNIMCIDKCNPV